MRWQRVALIPRRLIGERVATTLWWVGLDLSEVLHVRVHLSLLTGRGLRRNGTVEVPVDETLSWVDDPVLGQLRGPDRHYWAWISSTLADRAVRPSCNASMRGPSSARSAAIA